MTPAAEAVVVWDGRRDGRNRGHLCLIADAVKLSDEVALPNYQHLWPETEEPEPEAAKPAVRPLVASFSKVDLFIDAEQWLMLEAIASRAGVSVRAVQTRVRELMRLGEVERDWIPGVLGHKRVVYRRKPDA